MARRLQKKSIPSSKNLTWVKVDEKIRATAGHWSLLVELISGTMEIDKIVLTPNEHYHPH